MNLLDFAREYFTYQIEAMKKLIAHFLNLIIGYEFEQQTELPSVNGPRIILPIGMEIELSTRTVEIPNSCNRRSLN